jgi:tetratricopeptide (TPR) repeat protein
MIQMSRPLSELRGPERIGDVVRQRLSRLASETTGLLELAAVAGSRFELRVLTAASPLDRVALRVALDEATRSGILDELPEQPPAYRFTHELVRRAIYDRVTAVRRAELHLCVGEALEATHAWDPARGLPELAHHFTLAAPVAGVTRAVDYNRRAAEAATASGAFEEAAARLSTALELGIPNLRERVRVQLDLDYLLRETGRRAESNAVFAAALEATKSIQDRGIATEALIQRLGRQLGDPLVDPEELLKDAEAAIDVFRDLQSAEGLARARRRRAHALLVGGRWDDARIELECALVDADASGRQDARRQVIGTLGGVLCHGPTPAVEAIRRCEALRERHRSDGVLDAVVMRCLSLLYAMAGRFEDARASAAHSGRFLEELDHTTHNSIYRTLAAEARELLGDRAGAEQELIEKWHRRAAWDYTPDRRAMETAYHLALLYCDDGKWHDAERCLDYGSEVPVPTCFRVDVVYGLAARARVAAHRGDLDEALVLARRGVELADVSDGLNLRARVWLVLAEVLRATADDAEADAATREAIRLYETKGNVVAAALLRPDGLGRGKTQAAAT